MANDQLAIDEIKKYSGGFLPDAYFAVKNESDSFIINFFLGYVAGGILGFLFNKTRLVALQGEHIYIIPTNSDCSVFYGEHTKIHRSEIIDVKCKYRLYVHNLTITLTSGKKLSFGANENYGFLEDRASNIAKFEEFLGVRHSKVL